MIWIVVVAAFISGGASLNSTVDTTPRWMAFGFTIVLIVVGLIMWIKEGDG